MSIPADKLGELLKDAEKRQLEFAKKAFLKHIKEGECRWSQGDYGLGRYTYLIPKTEDNVICCFDCEKYVTNHVVGECDNCCKKVCLNKCMWFVYVTVKDKDLRRTLNEMQICTKCKETLYKKPIPPATTVTAISKTYTYPRYTYPRNNRLAGSGDWGLGGSDDEYRPGYMWDY